MKQVLHQVNWTAILYNTDVHQQVTVINSVILNVFSNFVPNKIIAIDDRDPPWMHIYKVKNSLV